MTSSSASSESSRFCLSRLFCCCQPKFNRIDPLKRMGSSNSTPLKHSPVINTKCGPVRGKVYEFDEKKYHAYLGIPYAEPPVGELRFKKSQPVKPWSEVKDCCQFGPRCPQKDDLLAKLQNFIGIDEAKCLTLNVITPREKSKEWPVGLPVMIWIHGGGFLIHSSSNYGDSTAARNLCSKDVIFVSINYRLGMFGFLTTGDDKCRGNMGLWDQKLALEWVKENIEAFGGNSQNMTIFGQSAGGACVDLLCLSPHSQDLFQRAIPMAGNAECTFSVKSSEAQATVCRNFARKIGWKGEDQDTEGLLEFITSQPTKTLCVHISPNQTKFHMEEMGSVPLAAVIDGDFLPAPISEMRRRMPKKDIITGTTDHEGIALSYIFRALYTVKGMKKAMNHLIKESEYGQEYQKIREEIIDFYTKDVSPKDKMNIAARQSKFVGDAMVCHGTVEYAKKMAELGHNVYFYNFQYCNPSSYGLVKWFAPFTAATHGLELRYVLGKGVMTKFSPNSEDLKMLDKMTTFFTNFTKFGNPNGSGQENKLWEKHRSDEPYRHLNIQLPELEMKDNYQDRRFDFWQTNVLPKNEAWRKIHEVNEPVQ